MSFNLNNITRVETKEQKNNISRWKKIALLSLLISGATANFAYAAESQSPKINNTQFTHNVEYDGYKTQEMNAEHFHINDTKMMENIKKSTVFIALTNDNWIPLVFGTGSVLRDHKSNGEKNILTVLHVSGVQDTNKKFHIVVFSSDGKMLGVANPMTKSIPKETSQVTSDQPTLLEFSNEYPVNTEALNQIEGVELAHTLPRGMMSGVINSGVGVSPGASGGPWFNENGKLIGVIGAGKNIKNEGENTFNSGLPNINSVFKHSLLLKSNYNMKDIFLSKNDNSSEIFVPRKDTAFIQGLGAPSLLEELKTTRIQNNREDYNVTENISYNNSFGLGYPMGFSVAYRTDNLKISNPQEIKDMMDAANKKELNLILSNDRKIPTPEIIAKKYNISLSDAQEVLSRFKTGLNKSSQKIKKELLAVAQEKQVAPIEINARINSVADRFRDIKNRNNSRSPYSLGG